MKIQFIIAILLLSGSLVLGLPRQSSAGSNLPERRAAATQDDIWAVIEYPEGREVAVEIVPTATMPTAKGTARVLRGASGAEINLELTGLTTDVESYHVFAIDSLGNATALGTLTVSDGSSSLRAQTALTKFMLVISSRDDLVTLSADTPVILRSTVPEGFQIVPRISAPETVPETAPVTNEEPSLISEYDVPLLGIGSLKRATQMKARVFDETEGSRINASVTPGKKGMAQIKLVIRDLKPAPDGKNYVAWAIGPEKEFLALGQILPGKQSKLESTTEFTDFGIFITMEDSGSPPIPTGKMVAMIIR